MWAELSAAWQAALEEAWAAYCAGTTPIGACVTDGEGRLLSRGRNRIRDLSAPPGQTCRSQISHAELNTLLSLGPRQPEMHSYVLYTTLEPCPMCMGAIYMSGVRRFHYAARDAYAGSVDLLGSTPYYRRKAMRASGPPSVVLEDAMIALNTEFFLRDNPATFDLLSESWTAAVPRGVALGRRLAEDGRLWRLAQSGAGAQVGLDSLAGWIDQTA